MASSSTTFDGNLDSEPTQKFYNVVVRAGTAIEIVLGVFQEISEVAIWSRPILEIVHHCGNGFDYLVVFSEWFFFGELLGHLSKRNDQDGSGRLEAGESRAIRLSVRLSANLVPGQRYAGTWEPEGLRLPVRVDIVEPGVRGSVQDE